MGYRLRYQSKPWATHHVVSRCIQGYCLLKPTPEVLNRIAGVLGRALHMYSGQVELHAYVFLSNHFHLLISSETATSLSEFMKYLKSNLTRELNDVHNRSGSMWQRRYSSEEILDAESYDGLFKYLTEHSVKEGLVDHPREWSGLHSYHQLIEGRDVQGDWLDRTALREAQRSGSTRGQVTEEKFTTTYPIKITRPPQWAGMSEGEYHIHCVGLTESAIKNANLKRGDKRSLGMEAVLSARVDEARPVKRRRHRSLCRARYFETRFVYSLIYGAFKARYQKVYRDLRDGHLKRVPHLDSLFPVGGVLPLGTRSLVQLE